MTLPRPGTQKSRHTRQLLLEPLLSIRNNGEPPTLEDADTELINSSSTGPDPEIQKKNKVGATGRPFSAPWQFFDRIDGKAKCKHCDAIVSARPKHVMKPHLLRCKKAKMNGLEILQVCPELKDGKEYELMKKEQAGLLFDQKISEKQLFNMMLATGIAFSVLDNKHFKSFLKSLNSLFQPFSRYSMVTERIPRYQGLVMESVTKLVAEQSRVTLSIDGWTTRANEGIYGVTVVTTEGREFIYDTIDLGTAPASAENISKQLLPIIKEIGVKRVVGLVTDGAPNMKKLRDLVQLSYRNITGVYCLVHAFNLFCLAIFKDTSINKLFKSCCRVIEAFNRSSKLTEFLKQCSINLGSTPSKLVSIGSTRFSTSYEALETLLKNKGSLQALQMRSDVELPTDVAESLGSSQFWESITTLQKIMAPLNKAIKYTQKPVLQLSESCYICIDVVFHTITLASLSYSVLESSTIKHISECCVKLLGSYIDENIYFLALTLDLQFNFILSDNKQEQVDKCLREYVMNYSTSIEDCDKVCEEYKEFLVEKGSMGKRDAIHYWKNESPFCYLSMFAISILSITSSSMSCERAFSTMGWLNSQRRSSISKSTLVASAMIYRHLADREIPTAMGGTYNSYGLPNEEYDSFIEVEVNRLLRSPRKYGNGVMKILSDNFKGDMGLSSFLNSNGNSVPPKKVQPKYKFAPTIMALFETH